MHLLGGHFQQSERETITVQGGSRKEREKNPGMPSSPTEEKIDTPSYRYKKSTHNIDAWVRFHTESGKGNALFAESGPQWGVSGFTYSVRG